jgi:hypothetical protein
MTLLVTDRVVVVLVLAPAVADPRKRGPVNTAIVKATTRRRTPAPVRN